MCQLDPLSLQFLLLFVAAGDSGSGSFLDSIRSFYPLLHDRSMTPAAVILLLGTPSSLSFLPILVMLRAGWLATGAPLDISSPAIDSFPGGGAPLSADFGGIWCIKRSPYPPPRISPLLFGVWRADAGVPPLLLPSPRAANLEPRADSWPLPIHSFTGHYLFSFQPCCFVTHPVPRYLLEGFFPSLVVVV